MNKCLSMFQSREQGRVTATSLALRALAKVGHLGWQVHSPSLLPVSTRKCVCVSARLWSCGLLTAHLGRGLRAEQPVGGGDGGWWTGRGGLASGPPPRVPLALPSEELGAGG